jgi:hypothetical protein
MALVHGSGVERMPIIDGVIYAAALFTADGLRACAFEHAVEDYAPDGDYRRMAAGHCPPTVCAASAGTASPPTRVKDGVFEMYELAADPELGASIGNIRPLNHPTGERAMRSSRRASVMPASAIGRSMLWVSG